MAKRRSKDIVFRVTPEEKRAIERLAKRADWTVSEYLRAAALAFTMATREPGVALAAGLSGREIEHRIGRKSKATRDAETLLGKALS